MAALERSQPPGTSSAMRNAFGTVLSALILVLIGVLAFSIRLFSVIKYESVIHEFDPYFNYRVTQFLSNNGIYEFWNWFDDRTWDCLPWVNIDCWNHLVLGAMTTKLLPFLL
ncbi:unnamed protein product [Brassica rapa]|uniref:dolichyl-diphosphooligosaccharide--protein glycotransferase n=1 Tax=Brassica campestris TaxID=3711 RepID=A0A3P6ANQ4_BRACM|nr:unnamed protein product [Brassica rapa]VDC85861.1 unnamed protein product [Brassica rapa]